MGQDAIEKNHNAQERQEAESFCDAGEKVESFCDAGEKEEYVEAGIFEGYRVFVCFDQEGPDREEAMALYQEARRSALLRHLAEDREEGEG